MSTANTPETSNPNPDARGTELTHVAMIHTVPALAASFHEQVLAEFEGEAPPRIDHLVDPWLLAEATRTGVTPEIEERVGAHASYLAAGGASLIMLTCSSIGGTAELATRRSGCPVLRLDASMAADANRIAGDGIIAVLATLTSTLGPTTELIRSSTPDGAAPSIQSVLVEGAAAARSSGDQARHDELIRNAVAGVQDAAVIVLAQASMAPALAGGAEDAAGGMNVPVLTSPPGAVAAFAAAIRSL